MNAPITLEDWVAGLFIPASRRFISYAEGQLPLVSIASSAADPIWRRAELDGCVLRIPPDFVKVPFPGMTFWRDCWLSLPPGSVGFVSVRELLFPAQAAFGVFPEGVVVRLHDRCGEFGQCGQVAELFEHGMFPAEIVELAELLWFDSAAPLRPA